MWRRPLQSKMRLSRITSIAGIQCQKPGSTEQVEIPIVIAWARHHQRTSDNSGGSKWDGLFNPFNLQKQNCDSSYSTRTNAMDNLAIIRGNSEISPSFTFPEPVTPRDAMYIASIMPKPTPDQITSQVVFTNNPALSKASVQKQSQNDRGHLEHNFVDDQRIFQVNKDQVDR